MASLLTLFQAVSLIFALSAIGTGLQAILAPASFASSFGIPLGPMPAPSPTKPKSRSANTNTNDRASAYVSLMGVRQLATGITLLVFAQQGKWQEMATILSILGIVVAGTDGVFLAMSGQRGKGVFHALPGAMISGLSWAVLQSQPL